MTSTTQTLTEYLRSLGCYEVEPLSVTIGRTTFEAARYKQLVTIDEFTQAYKSGKRQYVREAIYCLGPLPNAYSRSSRVSFSIPGDERDWFIASYFPGHQALQVTNEYHPFGHMFQLQPWTHDERIDKFETRKRRRMTATITSPAELPQSS